ncbi:MAG: hypothetical protein RL154_1284 [Pseudomonadota bacterium]|jgi:uncharacterized membrane protein (DUF373 family)
MSFFDKFLCQKCVSVEIVLAAVLFIYGTVIGSFVTAVLDGLYFIIFLEITRTAVDYAKKPNHRVKIRYLIDAVIIADLREIMMILVDGHNIMDRVMVLSIYFIALMFLFFVRYMSMKISPDEYESEYKSNG